MKTVKTLLMLCGVAFIAQKVMEQSKVWLPMYKGFIGAVKGEFCSDKDATVADDSI